MSDERLSKEMLDDVIEYCEHRVKVHNGAGRVSVGLVLSIATELRTLRAAMPTEEEREALVPLVEWLRTRNSNYHVPDWEHDALAALDKLTKEKP